MSDNLKCDEKMVFDTKKEAQNTASVAEFQRDSKLTVYKCSICHLWHLSSKFGGYNDN